MNSRVAIVGMGALGSVLANHMVRAGVGFVRIIDRDFVETSNLQRQMLYTEADASGCVPKAIAAANHLRRVNSSITIDPHVIDLNSINAEALLTDVDLILDGTDNHAIRYLINDVSVKHQIPWVYGGAIGSKGVCITLIPHQTPCLQCLFKHAPIEGNSETCDTAGVIGPIIHVIASFQASEALKILIADEDSLLKHMLQIDLWNHQIHSIDISNARKHNCPCCSSHHFEYLEYHREEALMQSLCGRNSIQIVPIENSSLNLDTLNDRLKLVGTTEITPFLLKFNPDDEISMIIFSDRRVIIQGTIDPIRAKSLYSRYIGM